jgi:hypothetical protein
MQVEIMLTCPDNSANGDHGNMSVLQLSHTMREYKATWSFGGELEVAGQRT